MFWGIECSLRVWRLLLWLETLHGDPTMRKECIFYQILFMFYTYIIFKFLDIKKPGSGYGIRMGINKKAWIRIRILISGSETLLLIPLVVAALHVPECGYGFEYLLCCLL